jgi:hypothetical protein
MTTAILINAILAVAILATIVGLKIWAIRTQHHDRIGAAERRLGLERRAHAHRAHAARTHAAHEEHRSAERRAAAAWS